MQVEPVVVSGAGVVGAGVVGGDVIGAVVGDVIGAVEVEVEVVVDELVVMQTQFPFVHGQLRSGHEVAQSPQKELLV